MQDYLLFYLAKAYWKENRCEEAREVFRELLGKYPKSRWAPLAEGQVRTTEPCPPLVVPRPPIEKVDCDAIDSDDQKANCLLDTRRYPEAKILFLSLLKVKVRGPKEIGYLVGLSQSAARSQDTPTALLANQSLHARHPKTAAAHDALKKIAFLYQDSGDYQRAIPVWEELISLAHASGERRRFWEELGWCYYRLRQYQNATEAFDAASAEENSPFGLYWKGRSLEQLGKKRAAKETYHLLIEESPKSYYGLKALQRIYGHLPHAILKGWWTQVGGVRWSRQRLFLEDSQDLRRIQELQTLGLSGDRDVETRRFRHRWHFPLKNVAHLNRGHGGYYLSVRVPQENQDYPLPYADFIFSEVKKTKMDPFLLYAMMRQESHYKESVVSRVGARGILQIMPETGWRLARKARWDEFDAEWLFEPLTNIELAVNYLGKLSHFNRWYLVVSAYSAGESQVKAWLKTKQGLAEDEFIEEIPYEETRNYVKRVFTHYAAYRWIY